MFVIYLPDDCGFYGGLSDDLLSITDYEHCMHFNSIFCSDWYQALIVLAQLKDK